MRYPSLRYGNPAELRYYVQGIPLIEIARRLRRDERTVRDWLNEARPVPWWVPEILRLWEWEWGDRCRRMGIRTPLAVVIKVGGMGDDR